MTDYSTVAPPQNLAGNFDTSSAFADALQRARQIAAKINTPNSDGGSNNAVGGGTKRPLEDSAGMDWGEQNVTKKMAALNDHSGGLPDRPCSLTGRKQAIDKAKDMIMDIVNRGSTSTLEPAGPMSDGLSMVEMMIPASKVGLIIGKGGETIKNLQERAGVKMVMIQDGMFSSSSEKPLRIKGEPQKADFARQLIMDLLTERELENMNRGFNRNEQRTNDYGTGSGGMQEVAVPRQAVGVVIGKGGEMIKKIQQDSGARVQFQQEDGPGDRMCFLTGSPDQVQAAQNIIHELINSVLARDQQNMGRGRGRGGGSGGGGGGGRGNFDDRRGGGAGRGGDFMSGNSGMGRGGQSRGPPDWIEITYSVPANKCGIVIGKGGETIRAINQQTGAHVELSRNPSSNQNEKLFVIRGLPNQIDHAKQLINEKVGGGGGPSGSNNVSSGGYGMPPGGPSPPQGVPGYPQNNSQQPPPGPQGYTPQGWGGGYQHWQGQPGATNPSAAGGDPNKQAADANAAAWAAYYAQYTYPQTQPGAQPAQSQPASQGQQQPAGQAPTGQNSQNSQGAQQPDYSAAWAEYYRSMGMYREAEMIEQQARGNQSTPGQPAGTPQQPTASQPAGANAQSQPPAQAAQPSQQPSSQGQQQYSQYGQYSQYTQQQQGAYPYNYAAAYPQPQ